MAYRCIERGSGMTMEDHGVRVNNVALPVLRRALMPSERYDSDFIY